MAINDIQIAVSQEFFTAYSRIPQKQQTKVMQFVNKFRTDPTGTGINYEKIQVCKDQNLRSVRIDDTYRGIVLKPKTGNVYLLLWVDHHDKAYDWARNRVCEINPQLGTLQIYQVSETQIASSEKTEKKTAALFEALRDRELLRLGAPEKLIPTIRSILSNDDLTALSDTLPPDVYLALSWISQGETYDDVVATLADYGAEEKAQVDTEDFSKALLHPVSRQLFQVDPSEEELIQMLNAPLEKWRVFLHPAQLKIVERDWNGPVRVLGGAGTGKTVVAMHRARWLSERLPKESDDKILFTTFTRNLAADIQANLEKIVPRDLLKRIEVVNLDKWVTQFLRQSDYDLSIDYGKSSKEFWEKALTLAPPELNLPASFYKKEWEQIIQPQEITSFTQYLAAPRTGRGVRLDRKERKDIWPVFEEYQLLLSENKLREPADAMRDARLLLESDKTRLPYRHIIVDEAQDMGMQAFRLLRAIVPEGPNDCFIVGDAHQRIYNNKVVLGQCGIKVVGRSMKLRINYRTTEETRRWAIALMNGIKVDDLDGGEDMSNGYISLVHGVEPMIAGFDTIKAEADAIAAHLNDIKQSDGFYNSTCVVTRTNKLMEQYEAELSSRGIDVYRVQRSVPDDRRQTGVRIATMHRVKGLEFDRIILCGINKGIVPLETAELSSDDITVRKNADAQERALLFVAATRAKKSVMITSCGEVCPYLV
jgi:hypothetical protein